MADMTTKPCFKCKDTKPLSDFYKHPDTNDGHLGKCKACTKSDALNRYWSNRERIMAYDRTRHTTEAARAKRANARRRGK